MKIIGIVPVYNDNDPLETPRQDYLVQLSLRELTILLGRDLAPRCVIAGARFELDRMWETVRSCFDDVKALAKAERALKAASKNLAAVPECFKSLYAGQDPQDGAEKAEGGAK